MNWAHRLANKGFTIVELLIVIVVIGILASITIVAYNGIQARATNAVTESTAGSYIDMLKTYVAQYSKYPLQNISGCLGSVADYGARNCYATNPSATLEAELKKIASPLPNQNTECNAMYGGACRYNMSFLYQPTWLIDGVPHDYYLIYYLKNNGNCTLPNNLEGSFTNYSSTVSRKYMERNSGTSMCVVALPDAA